MTRKRWRVQEQMLVPAVWQGSVEHYYHFLLGYFVPLVRWQEQTGVLTFAVRDCGPMNPWFDLLRPGTRLTYLPPGVMLERYLSHRQERVVLHDWDNPQRFHSKTLQSVRASIVSRAEEARSGSDCRRIVIIDRRRSSDFYRSTSAEVQGSGAEERSVSNVSELAETLHDFGEVTVVEPAELTPREQILLFSETRLLIGQHGAGLANMLWLPADSFVLELQPPLPPIIDTIFKHLAAALGQNYAVVPQRDAHAPVDPFAIARAAESLLNDSRNQIPARPGRWPTRLLRRLPRRL